MKREDIEQAAKEEADKLSCLVYYGGSAISQEDVENAFIAGAEWHINSVWNKNDVTPGYDCRVLIEDIYGNVYDDKYDADYNEYESAIEQKEIKRWAYIEDLLPTKEDKQ